VDKEIDIINNINDFILSMKDHFTLIAIAEKITGGKPTGRQALVIGVKKKLPEAVLTSNEMFWDLYELWKKSKPHYLPLNSAPPTVPRIIMGMETDIIETDEIKALPQWGKGPQLGKNLPLAGENNRKKWRPQIPAGCSMIADLSTACSFTAWVKDKTTGKKRMIVANHCGLAVLGCTNVPAGYPWVQPSPLDGGTSLDHVAKRGPEEPNIRDKYVDGAILDPDDEAMFTNAIVDQGTIDGKALDPQIAEAIYKSGRTTGTGQSPIAMFADVNINYGACGVLTKKDCILAMTINLQGGDSGDPATIVRNGKRLIVGQWNAGSSTGLGIAMKIGYMETKYNCDFDISEEQPQPPPGEIEYSADSGPWTKAKTINVRAANQEQPSNQEDCWASFLMDIENALFKLLACLGVQRKR